MNFFLLCAQTLWPGCWEGGIKKRSFQEPCCPIYFNLKVFMCLFVLRFTCLTWPSSILPQGADLTCLRHLGVHVLEFFCKFCWVRVVVSLTHNNAVMHLKKDAKIGKNTCTRSSFKCWNPRSFRGAKSPDPPTRLCPDPAGDLGGPCMTAIFCDSWFICCSKTKWKPWMFILVDHSK